MGKAKLADMDTNKVSLAYCQFAAFASSSFHADIRISNEFQNLMPSVWNENTAFRTEEIFVN